MLSVFFIILYQKLRNHLLPTSSFPSGTHYFLSPEMQQPKILPFVYLLLPSCQKVCTVLKTLAADGEAAGRIVTVWDAKAIVHFV